MNDAARLPGAMLGMMAAAALLAPAALAAESLEDAWQRATEHDYALAAATADLEGARANERAARGGRWPALTASAGYTRFDTAPQFDFAASGSALQLPIFDGDQYASSTVQMKLPLFTGGRISAGIGAAHQATLGSAEAERAQRSSLRLAVAESYVNVLRAQRLYSTAQSSVLSLTAHASDVAGMVERELVARNDLLAARVALANAEQQRVRAENAVAVAFAAYNRRLGEALDRTPALEDNVPVDATLAAEPIEMLVQRALESRGEIRALAARADALGLQARAERAELLPQLAVTGGYTYFETEILDRKDFSSVGIGFTWNLFDGGQARNRSAALRSASRAERHRAQDLRSQVELEVREAWLGVREAQARVAAAREAVAQSEENLRIARELYGTGLGTNTQVLEAVTLQISATSNRDNAVLDASLAMLRLARAVGSL